MTNLNLDALAEYLDGDDNHHGLDLMGTHGFLVATIVGPTLNNWQDALFDGNLSAIPVEIVTQIELWREQIRASLHDEQHIDFPVEIETAEVESDLGDWCIGFVDAMFINEDADWFDVDEEAVSMLTTPMMVFSGIEEDDPDLIMMRQNPDLLEEMAEEIPENVTKLFLLFHAPDA